MPRLIDADALVQELLSLTYLGCDGGYYKGMADERDATLRRIDAAPTIDAVPVVRCVDCRHVVTRETSRLVCGLDYEFVEPEHYCASGSDMRKRSDVE